MNLAIQGKFTEAQCKKAIPTQKSLRILFFIMLRQGCLFILKRDKTRTVPWTTKPKEKNDLSTVRQFTSTKTKGLPSFGL